MNAEQDRLVGVIKEVGDEIYLELSTDCQVVKQADEWLSTHGITRVERSTEILCRLTAYDRLLKTTIYALYQLDRDDLKPIQSVDEITDCLVNAGEITNNAAFEEYVLDDVAASVDQQVFEPLFDARAGLANSDNPTDDIGRIFEEIVPKEARRKLGQFRTPMDVADLMGDWVIENGPDTVLDPGMGAGVLTAEVYKQKLVSEGKASVEDLFGVDTSELSVVMTTCALKLVNGEGTPHFYHQDFMDSVAKSDTTRLIQRSPRRMPKVDAVVSNPPYSRHHELEEDDKDRINEIAELEAGMSISKRAPMYHYFYVHATQFLEESGRLSFVTPTEFLETNYGEQLKQFLLNNFAIHGLVTYDTEIDVFDGATTTSCISFLERQIGEKENHEATFVKLSKWPGKNAVREAIEGDTMGETEWGYVNKIPQGDITAEAKWTQFTNPDSVDSIPGLKSLGQIADANRGIATGMNSYFCLSKEEIEEFELQNRYLKKVIRRTKDIDSYEIRKKDWDEWRDSGREVHLLYLYDGEEVIKNVDDPSLNCYLKYGREIGADDTYLAGRRDPWYRVDQRDPPDILVSYMSNNGFKFIDNTAGTLSLNNIHNIYFNKDYTDNEKRAVLAYLNSNIVNEIVANSGRTYSDNLKKIEPNELEGIPVIDPHELTADDVVTLRRHFDDLCEVARSDECNTKKARYELNSKVSEILGLDENQHTST